MALKEFDQILRPSPKRLAGQVNLACPSTMQPGYFVCIFSITFKTIRRGMKGIIQFIMKESWGSLIAINAPFIMAS